MRPESSDPAPEPGKSPLGKERARRRRARHSLVDRKLTALIGLAMIDLAWLPDPDSGQTPARVRMARGDGDQRAQTLAFAFSPDGTTIATTHTDGRVALRSPTEDWSLQRFRGDRGNSWAVAFSPDGRSLALGGFGPDIVLCDLGSKGADRPMGIGIEQANALAFSPGGRILAAASSLSYQILLWDMAERRERIRLRGHSHGVISLAFAPDGRSLASGSLNDRAIIVWDPVSGGWRLRLPVPPGPVMALACSPDGSLLASASAVERSVRLWDLAAGRLVRLIASYAPSLNSIAFAPDGRLLATADNDGTVKLWSVATGRRLACLDGQADRLGGVAFAPDGRTLAAIANDNDVRLWDVTEVVGTLTNHPADR
jgi:WD40 repeat protein